MHYTILLKKKSYIFAQQSQFLEEVYGNFHHIYIHHCPKDVFLKFIYIFVNIGGCFVPTYLYHIRCLVPTVAKQAIGSPRTEGRDNCEPLHVC